MAKKEETVDVVTISPVTHEYGREDLNELRDKLNEVIKRIQ